MLKLGIWILVGLTAFRYWACLQIPIMPFEAYLRMCAHRLDVAFFDGPAGPAMLVYWGGKLFANDLFAFRWSAPLFALFATVIVYIFGKKLYGSWAGLASALLVNILPSFQISSVRLEGTLPALAFWSLGVLCVWNALKTSNWRWWVGGGIALALGLQFSYWLLLMPLGCILCIFGKRSYLSGFSIGGCAILLCFSFIGLAGPLEWNIRQNWIPFSGWTWQTFFTAEMWGADGWSDLFAQLSPPGACLVGISLILCFRNIPLSLRARFLAAFIAPPLAATLLLIFHDTSEGPLLFAVMPLFVWFGGWWQRTFRVFSWGSAVACAAAAVYSMLALMALPSHMDKGLQIAALTVEKIARIQCAAFPLQLGKMFLIGETPTIVAEFEYALDQIDRVRRIRRPFYEIFLRESPDLSNQFRLWPSYADFYKTETLSDPLFTEQKGVNRYLGRSALYITSERGLLPQAISAAFEKVIPLHTLEIRRKDHVRRQLNVYLCYNYQTLPL